MNYTDILNGIPDKRVDKNTTSLKFKQDLINFFQPLHMKNCVEIGTSLGYSTRVLSFLFDNVTTIDIDYQNIQKACSFNSDRGNITFLHGNASDSDWDADIKFDVSFIDANHLYDYVISDAKQSIKYGVDNMYIVFDDYGLPDSVPAVKMAVDEMISNDILKVIKYIGEPAGNEPRIGRPLIDWEGVICQVV
jgi:hypothetical protein